MNTQTTELLGVQALICKWGLKRQNQVENPTTQVVKIQEGKTCGFLLVYSIVTIRDDKKEYPSVQILAWLWIGTKLLSERMQDYCELEPYETNFSKIWMKNTPILIRSNVFENVDYKMTAILLRPLLWYILSMGFHTVSPSPCMSTDSGSLNPGRRRALIVWWPTSFWLQWTMTEGTVRGDSTAKFPTKPTQE